MSQDRIKNRVMRVVLMLDEDVAMLLKQEVGESGQWLRDLVNRILRVGLLGDASSSERFEISRPRSMG